MVTRAALLGLALGAASSACSSHGEEAIGRTSSAIVYGTASDAAQDFVVMLVFSDPAANLRAICTAALVAPRLVLTARHCVSETDVDVGCAADGSATIGGKVRANFDARKLAVYTGNQRPDIDPATAKPAGRGLEILDDGATNLCNHDLALVLLEQPIEGVPLATIRLEGSTEGGEGLTTVGWGVTISALEPGTRQTRTGVKVTRVGPDETSPVLAPSEFTFDESICLGDSGGPILAASTGAVVGVVSRGGNGRASQDPADTCTSATNLGTKLGPFRDLLTRSFARAGASPRLEAQPAADDGGCNTAPRRRAPPTAALLPLAALLLLLRRRRPVLG